MELILILALLIVKHFIADFVLQYQYMVEQKGIYGADGGIHHAGIHAAGTLLILLMFIDPFSAFIFALIDGIIHYHIDWAKMNLSRGLTPSDNKFWVLLGLDQMLHSLTYVGFIAMLVG